MIVNQTNVSNLYTALNTLFNAAFGDAETFYQRVAMVVPSGTNTNDYKFMLQFPMLREWLGDRQIRSLPADAWQLTNKDYEATIEVDRNDIADDQVGLYNPLAAELGRAAKQHPDVLMAALLADAFDHVCYDGQYFIDDDHPVGASTQSNDGAGSGTAWYLLDTTKMVKPFIFQQREAPQLVRMDRADDEQVFMRKKFRYGVDYRGAAGYGLWQLCYGSKQTLNADNYAAARAAMMAFTNDDGVPLGIRPNLLVVPPSLEANARELLLAQQVIGDATAGGAKTNIWQGTAELLVVPYLS